MREAVCVCVNVVKRTIDHTHVSSSMTVPTRVRTEWSKAGAPCPPSQVAQLI